MNASTLPALPRVVTRSLLKQVYRYTHRRAFRHNEDFWPWLGVTRDTTGRLRQLAYRQQPLPVRNAGTCRNTEQGSLHLLTTGPSARALSSNALQGRRLMGVNGAFHLSPDLEFDYYVVIDRGFAHTNRGALRRLLRRGTHLFTTPFCLYALLDETPLPTTARITVIEQFTERLYRPILSDAQYIERLQPYSSETAVFRDSPLSGFSNDISLGVFDAQTVAYTALQIAVYLGFDDLRFLGLDMKTSAAQQRFYEKGNEGPRSSLNQNLETHILPAFAGAAALLEQRGIQLTNHALNSAIPETIIPRRHYTPL